MYISNSSTLTEYIFSGMLRPLLRPLHITDMDSVVL